MNSRVSLVFLFLFLLVPAPHIFSQNAKLVQVKGVVVNERMIPLAFTHILIKNRDKGAITDQNGVFDFFTPEGDTLMFSCVGYKRKIIIVPIGHREPIFHIVAKMQSDTLFLGEATVFPWKTYAEFKQAVIHADIPEDDYIRAEKNFAIMQMQMILYEDELPAAPGGSYRTLMQPYYDQLYWKGQTQPMQIFNVFAWEKFFRYLKEGKFKRKKKK